MSSVDERVRKPTEMIAVNSRGYHCGDGVY